MKGGPLDRRSGKSYRFEVGCRRQDPRPAEADRDREDFRFCLFRREFIGNGPAGNLDRIAKPRLLGKGVDFDDHTVGGIRQAVAAVVPAVDKGDDVFDIRKFPVLPIDLEAKFPQIFQEFFLAFDGNTVLPPKA